MTDEEEDDPDRIKWRIALCERILPKIEYIEPMIRTALDSEGLQWRSSRLQISFLCAAIADMVEEEARAAVLTTPVFMERAE